MADPGWDFVQLRLRLRGSVILWLLGESRRANGEQGARRPPAPSSEQLSQPGKSFAPHLPVICSSMFKLFQGVIERILGCTKRDFRVPADHIGSVFSSFHPAPATQHVASTFTLVRLRTEALAPTVQVRNQAWKAPCSSIRDGLGYLGWPSLLHCTGW